MSKILEWAVFVVTICKNNLVENSDYRIGKFWDHDVSIILKKIHSTIWRKKNGAYIYNLYGSQCKRTARNCNLLQEARQREKKIVKSKRTISQSRKKIVKLKRMIYVLSEQALKWSGEKFVKLKHYDLCFVKGNSCPDKSYFPACLRTNSSSKYIFCSWLFLCLVINCILCSFLCFDEISSFRYIHIVSWKSCPD